MLTSAQAADLSMRLVIRAHEMDSLGLIGADLLRQAATALTTQSEQIDELAQCVIFLQAEVIAIASQRI